jgi:putative transposase
MLLHQNFKSFFASIKDYATAPEKYKGAPKPPQYKHGENGRFIAMFTNQTFSKPKLKQGIIALSGTDIEIKALHDNVQQVRIVPQNTGDYKIELVYNRAEIQPKPNNDRYAGIDMGLNNLMCIGTNVVGVAPIIINGRPLKSVNQYYNKRRAELNSKLPTYIGTDGKKRQQKTSKRLCRLTQKRNNKIKDYVHKSTRKVVDYLKQNDINTVVVGKNKGWKDEINIGRKNNQNFVSIPHATAINTLSYKLILEGITPIVREESYTSKCSFIDLEPIKKHETNKGRRIKRGLFKASDGQLINADLNAAYNILRKEVPNAYADGIEGLCVSMKHYVVTPLLLQVDVGHGVKLKRA